MPFSFDFGFASAPLVFRDVLHDAWDVVATAPPGGFVYQEDVSPMFKGQMDEQVM
jgi:hypothetical protein